MYRVEWTGESVDEPPTDGLLEAVREAAEAIARAADEALRTGDLKQLVEFDLARANAARHALLEALRARG